VRSRANPGLAYAWARLLRARPWRALLRSIFNASSETEIETAFAKIVQARPGALLVGSDPFFAESALDTLYVARNRLINNLARCMLCVVGLILNFARSPTPWGASSILREDDESRSGIETPER
jgi:hypothetical protein